MNLVDNIAPGLLTETVLWILTPKEYAWRVRKSPNHTMFLRLDKRIKLWRLVNAFYGFLSLTCWAHRLGVTWYLWLHPNLVMADHKSTRKVLIRWSKTLVPSSWMTRHFASKYEANSQAQVSTFSIKDKFDRVEFLSVEGIYVIQLARHTHEGKNEGFASNNMQIRADLDGLCIVFSFRGFKINCSCNQRLFIDFRNC